MSNTINPYTSTRAPLQQRTEPAPEAEDESQTELTRSEVARTHTQSQDVPALRTEPLDEPESASHNAQSRPQAPDEASASRFQNTLEGVIDRTEDSTTNQDAISNSTSVLPGLSVDEQQMIYRYFPESPRLELRLYKPDLSTDKVDPGSIGSRVDLRG